MGSGYQRFDLSQKQNGDGILHDEISEISFRVYSSKELAGLSACQITNPRSFDSLHHPMQGGLYDLRMGPFSDRSTGLCLTCHLRGEHCPGHMGHIELPLPVFHPLFYQNIHVLLKMTCLTCHRFRAEDHIKKLFLVQQQLLDKGLIIAAQQASEFVVLPKNSSEEKKEKEGNETGGSQNIDVALIIARLENFLKKQLAVAQQLGRESSVAHSTQNVESLRKSYTKEFRNQNTRTSTCIHCGAVTKSIIYSNTRFIYEGVKIIEDDVDATNAAAKKRRKMAEREKSELNPQEIKQHFRQVWGWDHEIFKYLFPMLRHTDSEYPTDLFLVETLGVPPPRTRPCQMTGDIMTIHPQSSALEKVVETILILKQIMQVVNGYDMEGMSEEARALIESLKGDTPLIKMDEVWRELQVSVNSVLDRDMNRSSTGQGWGLKQLVERKQGLFRMHMMGKRVNFAARTVITPDPNIAVDEIGVPDVFAKRLTYRVPVTPWNVEELRDLVINGPDIHPGAVCIEDESGKRINISPFDPIQRTALAKTLLISTTGGVDSDTSEFKAKFVHRHLRNGDAMLLNRQPTLHKPSIMSHRARVLKGERVMRLHYSACKSYNADFDGDEMNAHFPQNEVARAEAYNIVNAGKQYLVPKDGTPLQGLIQDHVIAGVKMTVRGRFFKRADYQQLVFGALVDFPGKIEIQPPAILKPVPLWSGKQIISTVVMNLVPKGKQGPTLHSSSKIKATEWQAAKPRPWKAGGTPLASKPQDGPTLSEAEVIFRRGEFIAGILDKNQFGATPFSLVHAFFELYGGESSVKLQSALSKLFTNFLHTEGFTLGVRDILVTEAANAERKMIMEETRAIGSQCAASGVGFSPDDEASEEDVRARLERFHRESRKIPKRRVDIDRAYKEKLSPANNAINKACLPGGLIEKFPNNNLQLMVLSGAKGSSVNTMQISGLLGQIELEGKRPPLMISGKALPSFRPYDTQPRAGGFIDGRFMSGIRPQEFFYHCMAGREGLVDTAVKTSRSGYLQRCLIKLLEGLVVGYDMTVRDSDKSVIQFQYGEDSLDVCKSQYLRSDQLKFIYENRSVIGSLPVLEQLEKSDDSSEIRKAKRSFTKWVEKNGNEFRRRLSPFSLFSSVKESMYPKGFESGYPEMIKKQLVDEWYAMTPQEKKRYIKKSAACPDPLVSQFRPDLHYSSLTETMDAMIEKYLETESKNTSHGRNSENFEPDEFRRVMHYKFQTSLVDPGEPVGVLAAQSIGEPSTQMTLNTFHFAGRGEMNVTLGIPRLREILMVASPNIKTPSMSIPFLPHITAKEQDRLRTRLNRVTLADVLSEVHVSEKIYLSKRSRERRATLRFEFLQRKYYSNNFSVKPSEIMEYFQRTFISKVFMPVLSAVLKDKQVVVETGADKEKKGTNTDDDLDIEAPDAETERLEKLEREGVGEGHASSDEEELADDADATEMRKKKRQMDEETGDEFDEEEVDFMRDVDRQMKHDDGIDDEDLDLDDASHKDIELANENIDDGFEDMPLQSEDEDDPSMKTSKQKCPIAEDRRIKVLNSLQSKSFAASVVDFTFDSEKQLWCELILSFDINQRRVDLSNVVRKSAERGVIREVKNIKRAFIGKNEKGEAVITTEGVNIDAMFGLVEKLDVRRLFCNNIHDMAKYYGIEAANKTIVREITDVFKAYGITVNPRHLNLVADYMTFDGTYKPFNRIGIENNPSPLQQMTFETAIGFLRSATLGGKVDTLDSPSARLVVGKPCSGGTGKFQLRQRLLGDIFENSTFKNKISLKS